MRLTGPSAVSSRFLVVTLLVSMSTLALAGCGGCERAGVEKPELPPLDEVPPGAHDVVRAQYNDTTDIYRVFLAGRPLDAPLRLRGVRLALLTDEQRAAGKKPHLVNDGAGPLLSVGPRFKIGVLHGVVEERADDNGKLRNVVTRTERKMWSPFLEPPLADAKSPWHVPAVHYPPPLSRGPLVGSGGSGPTREAAWDDYRRRHGVLPQAVRLEFEGYALAKDLPKDDDGSNDRNDVMDAGTAAPAAPAAPAESTAAAGADAGPRTPSRVIGVRPGSRAVEAHDKLMAERRRKQTAEAQRKRRLQREKARPTP